MSGMVVCGDEQALKPYKSLPITIVEDHNEVIPHIYRAIGSKHLPMSDITLIHFDSHPDLLIPYDFPADNIYNKDDLIESLSIENWILPAVYAGHINNIYWIKPHWAEQLQDKTVEFFVGKCKESGCIRTSCKEPYFVSEGLYVPDDKLENKKKLTLTVVTLNVLPDQLLNDGESNQKNQPNRGTESPCEKDVTKRSNVILHSPSGCSNDKQSTSNQVESKKLRLDAKCDSDFSHSIGESAAHNTTSGNKTLNPKSVKETFEKISEEVRKCHFILDIDMDFFSTKNPFKEMFSEKQYSLLKELYNFSIDDLSSEQTIIECTSARRKQLAGLKSVFTALAKNPSREVIPEDGKAALKDLIEDLLVMENEVDFNLVHEAGCTCDDTELPHHVSTNQEIDDLMSSVDEVLKILPKPTFVTLSRSSDDDYCPQDQVEQIELKLLQVLESVYKDIVVNFEYGIGSDSEVA